MNQERIQDFRPLDSDGRSGDASPIVDERVTCQHHWLIEAPEGPTSLGICRMCGEERMFENNFADCSVYNFGHENRPSQTNVRQLQEV